MIAAYVGIASVVAGLALGWTVRDWRAGAEEAARRRAAALQLEGQQRGIYAASSRYQAGNAGADARERTVLKEVQRVVEKPVYREQCLDGDGLRVLTDDIDASNTVRGLGSAVPEPAKAGRQQQEGPPAVVP